VNGTLDLRSSTIQSSTVNCMSGTVTLDDVAGTGPSAGVNTTNCQTTVRGSRFTNPTNGSIIATGGILTVTNNLFVISNEFTDLLQVGGHAPGSIIAFNTIVNLTTVTQSPAAVTCDSTVRVSSNIFAYNSTNPLSGSGCIAESSLFDLQGTPDSTGNTVADVSTFFVDRSLGDFHLAPNSPARAIGESGLVTTDIEGNTRPMTPDVGAFEAP